MPYTFFFFNVNWVLIEGSNVDKVERDDECMRAALKGMPTILLCWATVSETGVGGMAAEVKPSQRCSVTCCCCAMDGSRRAV